MIGVTPTDFWRMTPAALAAVFREYNRARHDEALASDERAAAVVRLIAAVNGAKGFDETALFPRLWAARYGDPDPDAVSAKVRAWVAAYGSPGRA